MKTYNDTQAYHKKMKNNNVEIRAENTKAHEH